jgi:O-antigen/teichoic acid export membrane protein
VSIGLRGTLEGMGRFGSPAFARIVLGFSTFGLPVPLLAYWPSLDVLVIGLVLGRLVTVVTQGWSCRGLLAAALQTCGIAGEAKYLLSFGGWMMVSNLISPLMVFADRFVIAASAVASQLAYYTMPFEIVTRLLIVPAAVTTVLFPAMAGGQGADRERSALQLMLRGMVAMFIMLLPVVAVGSIYAGDFLAWWLDADFSAHGTVPMILLSWGVLLNSLAAFPFAYLQSMGKVRQIAYLHLLELPVYFMLLPWFLAHWGIVGAAIAWVIRVAFDLVMLLGISVAHYASEGRRNVC